MYLNKYIQANNLNIRIYARYKINGLKRGYAHTKKSGAIFNQVPNDFIKRKMKKIVLNCNLIFSCDICGKVEILGCVRKDTEGLNTETLKQN